MRKVVLTAEGMNLALLVLALFLLGQPPALAQAVDAGPERFMGAAIATGLAALGAGIAVGIAGAAAIGAVAEKPELLGRTLIFVGLGEGVAIYGLIVAFIILGGG